MSIHAAPPPEPSCPRCSASRVVRWGWVRTVRAPPRRRFRCLACRRTFSEHTGRALAGSWYPGRWSELCRELVEQTSVRQTARRLGVSPSTAFRWRHRALQVLADHRERIGRRQLGSKGLPPDADGIGLQVEEGTGGVVGVMGLPFKVTRRQRPEVGPRRFFRILVAADAAGRVAMDRDVPGEIVGPPGSPLPLSDWIWSKRAWARFPLGPADRVPSPRRLLDRWCAPGTEIRWMGWWFYRWSEVAAEFGMTAVRWTPGRMTGGGSEGQEAIRARDLAVALRRWLRPYRGVSTRWLRGYLALFAQLHEGRNTFTGSQWATSERSGSQRATRQRAGSLWATRQRWAELAWRLFEISVQGTEGAVAKVRRCWIR